MNSTDKFLQDHGLNGRVTTSFYFVTDERDPKPSDLIDEYPSKDQALSSIHSGEANVKYGNPVELFIVRVDVTTMHRYVPQFVEADL